MGLDPNVILQAILNQRAQQQRAEQDRVRSQRNLAQQLILTGAQQGANVQKLAGLIGSNVLDPGFITGASELSKIVNQRRKQEETQAAIPNVASTLATSQRAQQQAGTAQAQRSAVQNQADALSALFSGVPAASRPDVARSLALALPQARQGLDLADLQRRRAVADAGRARLVQGLGTALATVPEENRSLLLSQAREIARSSFPQASEEIMAQITTEAVLASSGEQQAGLTENQLRAAQRDAAIQDGAPPRLAVLAARGNAFKDPLTGIWRQGSPTGTQATSSGVRAGLVDVFSQLEALTVALAQAGGANALTGTLEDLRRTLGAQGDAIFGAFDATLANAQSLIQKARSGAVLNEEEIKLLSRALPATAQVRLRNGRLAPEVQSRLNAVFRVLESEHLGAFDRSQKAKARQAFREVRAESRERVRSEVLSEFRDLGIPIEAPRRPKIVPAGSQFFGIDPKSGHDLWLTPGSTVPVEVIP